VKYLCIKHVYILHIKRVPQLKLFGWWYNTPIILNNHNHMNLSIWTHNHNEVLCISWCHVREDIFKPTTLNESLHGISKVNVAWLVNFATSKNFTVKSTMFPYHKIHKYTWTSPAGKNWLYPDRQVKAFECTWCLIIQGSKLWYHYLVVAKVEERLLVNKQRSLKFHLEEPISSS
jgi:hypothetical protein